MARERTLKEKLARFMDPNAFTDSVTEPVKHIAPAMAKVTHDKLKTRRTIALKRADAAIRFFAKPENRAILDNRFATSPDNPE